MGVKRNYVNLSYGFNNALNSLYPRDIMGTRVPSSADQAEIGTWWVFANRVFKLTASGVWTELAGEGSTGTFLNLIVTGTTLLGGAVTMNTGSGAISIGTDLVAKDITIGSQDATVAVYSDSFSILGENGDCFIGTNGQSLSFGTGGGTISLTPSGGIIEICNDNNGNTIKIGTNGDNIINIGSGSMDTFGVNITSGSAPITLSCNANIVLNPQSGDLDLANTANDKNIFIGATTGANNVIEIGTAFGTSSLSLAAASGGININTGTTGNITIVSQTATSATTTVTNNAHIGTCTITGQTINTSSTITITLSNSVITTSKPVLLNVSTLNVSTNGGYLTVTGVIQAAGSLVIHATNNGAGQLTSSDTIIIGFMVLG